MDPWRQITTAAAAAGLFLAGCSASYSGAPRLGSPDNAPPRGDRQAHHARQPRRVPAPPIPQPARIDPVLPGAGPFSPRIAPSAPGIHPEKPSGNTLAQSNAPPWSMAATPPSEASFEDVSGAQSSPLAPRYQAPPDPQRERVHRFGEFAHRLAPNASPLDSQGNLRRVTFTTEGADFDIEVDPTGRWLAYASTRHRQTSDIYLQRVDGTAVTQLTTDPSNDVMPSFSPDGRRVAFASDRSGSWDIYLTDTAGGQAVKLTDDEAQNIHPSFSPDGRQMVYCSFGSRSGVWELVLIDLDAPTHRRIIGHGLFPNWSPAGDTIVYQRARQRGSRWFSVWTVEIEDGEAVRPTEIVASSNAAVITPQWSPDGRSIVFCTVIDPATDSTAAARADIWVCNADGSGRARLTQGSYGNLQPTWAADGSIYFVSDRGVDGVENIWSVRPDQAVHLARQNRRLPDAAEAQVPTNE